MNETPMARNTRSGATLIVVMGLTLLGTLAASSVAFSVGSRVRQTHSQVDLEQAFYLAAAGTERAASRVAGGNETSGTLTGTLGNGSFSAEIECQPGAGETVITVTSRGTVKGISRVVILRGLRRVSWARYALWYDSEPMKLWIAPGERFDGRVYSKPQLHFHNKDLATKGQVVFTDKVWTVPDTIEKASSSVNPVFEQGLVTGADVESMASVNFSDLLTKTTQGGGLVLEGESTIAINNKTLTITNSRKNWNKKAVTIPANGMVYVKTVTSGTAPRAGDIKVSAPNGLGSRLTLVADNDIKIVDHVRYKVNPKTTPSSTDALGLIAKRSVVVQTVAPDDLDIYAHIICQNGGFGVDQYDEGDSRGSLKVFGGIVNKVRNAVGIVGGAGYAKNYAFDTRFSKNPPPNYPVVIDELEWLEWEG